MKTKKCRASIKKQVGWGLAKLILALSFGLGLIPWHELREIKITLLTKNFRFSSSASVAPNTSCND